MTESPEDAGHWRKNGSACTVPVSCFEDILHEATGHRRCVLSAVPHEGPRGRSILFLETRTSSGQVERLVIKRFRTEEDLRSEARGLELGGDAGLLVPHTHAVCSGFDNPLEAPFIIMSHLTGVDLIRLKSSSALQSALDEVEASILRLYSAYHGVSREGPGPGSRLIPERLGHYAAECRGPLVSNGRAAAAAQLQQLAEDLVEWYETEGESLTRYPVSFVHGDLHLTNLFVCDHGRVGFIDWLESRWGDVAEDIAYYAVRTLPCVVSDVRQASAALADKCASSLGDGSLPLRFRYYVGANILETSHRAVTENELYDIVDQLMAKLMPALDRD